MTPSINTILSRISKDEISIRGTIQEVKRLSADQPSMAEDLLNGALVYLARAASYLPTDSTAETKIKH